MSVVTVEAIARCSDVEVVYGRGASAVHALAGVSVEIGVGDSLALLGRSGSGKTTLLHVFGGLVEPTAGSVEWDGVGRARGIGYVFQAANLLPHFTAFENVSFAAHLSPDDNDPRRVAQMLLGLVGLSGKVDQLPAELSGGEAQRVAIARALAQQPELLLCDEPTGHLDSDTAERVLDLIEALREEYGFALVIATHDVDVAARLGRELELEDGRIVGEEER